LRACEQIARQEADQQQQQRRRASHDNARVDVRCVRVRLVVLCGTLSCPRSLPHHHAQPLDALLQEAFAAAADQVVTGVTLDARCRTAAPLSTGSAACVP
jgi:hypothetical protein